MKKFLVWILAWLTVPGCYWENEETFYPESGICDTTSVSFSGDIIPLLSNNCLSCHSNSDAVQFAAGIALEDHSDVAASGNLIIGAIKHLDGFARMPRNMEKLDTCQISVFEAWVERGSPDN